MTAINTDKCIFCGTALDAHHQSICQPCIDRYKQDHSQEFAEMQLYYRLRQIKSEKCLVCGEPLNGKTARNPLSLDMDEKKNRGAHGDSSFMLGGLPSSSENPPALAVGSVNGTPNPICPWCMDYVVQAEVLRNNV